MDTSAPTERPRAIRPAPASVVATLVWLAALSVVAAGLAGAAPASRARVTAGSTPAPGGPSVPPVPGPGAAGPFYLAVGASASLGVQPAPGHRRGRPTDQGYADDVRRKESHRWPGLTLVQLGCSGTTVQHALYGGGPCVYPHGSQVATAVRFLALHRDRTVLATIDLGYNDIWPCLRHRRVDPRCVASALAAVRRDVPIVVQRLRRAGGDRLELVGLEHYDPFLSAWLHGAGGQKFATASVGVFDRLNTALARAYTRGGVRIAKVPAEWELADRGRVRLGAYGDLPADVARVCTASWACARHNVHPNAEGYRLIADAVDAALDTPAPAAAALGA